MSTKRVFLQILKTNNRQELLVDRPGKSSTLACMFSKVQRAAPQYEGWQYSHPDPPTPLSAGTTTGHLASVAMGSSRMLSPTCLYLPSSFSASLHLSLPFHCTVSLPHRHSHTPLSVSLSRLHQLSHCHLCVAVHARAVWPLVLPLALCERPLPIQRVVFLPRVS